MRLGSPAKIGSPPANLGSLPDARVPSVGVRSTHDSRTGAERSEMPRYIVERAFRNGMDIPAAAVVERNADAGVTWLHSYVSEDRNKTFCVYDGPSPEAIRKAAGRNQLPVEQITQVRVLDPYSYSSDRH